jgi:hypothetical protein
MTVIARSPDEPTGRANARPMTGSATSGIAVATSTRISLRSCGLQSPNTSPRSRDGIRPRFANSFAPKNERACATLKRGRGEDRVRAAPAVPCAKVANKKRTRAYRFSGNTPAFPAQWFYSLYRALPGETWLACHRRPRDTKHHRELDTSHWGVRTTRLCRPPHAPFVKSASASTAPRPNVSDDGQRPSLGTGWMK